jgi:hypothetical protein
MLRTLLALAAVVGQAPVPASPWTADDETICAAIMKEGDLRQTVDQHAAAASLPVPAPTVLFDRSLRVCEPSIPPTWPMGCLLNSDLESFAGGQLPNGRRFFSGRLLPEVRRDLAGIPRAESGHRTAPGSDPQQRHLHSSSLVRHDIKGSGCSNARVRQLQSSRIFRWVGAR